MLMGRRHNVVYRRLVFAFEADLIALRRIEADDGVVAGDSVVLDQSRPAPDLDRIVAGAAGDGFVAAAAGDQLATAAPINRIGAGAALDRIVAGAVDQVGAAAAGDQVAGAAVD